MGSSYRGLLATVKAELVGTKVVPQHRIELFHALDAFLPDFQSFLSFPGPRAEDRVQVANSPPAEFEDQDVQIAFGLSDEFNLNEVYCAGLVCSAHEKWNLHGGGRREIMQISAGVWFTERDSLISSLLLLLHAAALDKELDPDFVANIRLYIEKFLDAGIRTRLMSLIKELNEDESTKLRDSDLELYIKDSTGALVERRAAVQKSRLSLCHCLYLSCLITPLNAQEVKDLYDLLRRCSGDGSLPHDVIKLRITYTIMFSLTNILVSGAQGVEETPVMLGLDANFRQEFQKLILDASESNPMIEGFTGVIRLAWVTIPTLTKQVPETTVIGPTVEDDGILFLCLNRACDHDVFGFLNTQVFGTAAFQNDERVLAFNFTTSLCKLIMSLLSLPAGRQKIMELKYTSMMALDLRTNHLKDTALCNKDQAQNQAVKLQAQPLVSFLCFAREIFQRGPELVINNNDLWSFVHFAGEGHTSYFTLVAFLDVLTALAECKEGAWKVYDLLQTSTISNLGWQNLFTSLVVYDQQLRLCMDTANAFLPPFSEGDAPVVEAYLKVLKKVIEKGDAFERMQWFEDIEPLFKLLSRQNVPLFLKGALRNAIAACACVSSVMKEKVHSLLEQYDLPLSDMTHELNDVEARQKEYLSTLSYLNLRNVLTTHDFNTKGGRCFEFFRFVRDQVFGPYSQRLYSNPSEKWELVVAALHHFEILLSNFEPTDENLSNNADNGPSSEQSLPRVAITSSAAEYLSATPGMELMKDLKNGEVIYCNLMSIFMLGVKSLLEQRASQLYGPVLEEAISLSFQIIIHAFLKESLLAEACYPSLLPLHEVITQDSHQVVTLLEYVRYDKSQPIQRYSVKVMELLSARVPMLVSLLQEAEAVLNITEAYAACLEICILEAQRPENSDGDIGSLILRLLLANLCRPSPNITHLLLGFDVNQPVEKTTLQPNRHFSCLTVVLNTLDKLATPEVNAGLHVLSFQLLYELCVDPITCGPMVDLLRNGKYDFLPERTSRSSHDTCIEKGNSSISGTDQYSSEALDLEIQTCDFEPVAGPESGVPSNSKPEVGVLNPAPLATRCTTKENDGPGEGSVTALRSSWIQRLFPGIAGEGVKRSQSKGKEKQEAPAFEDTERLLIENASKSSEDFGSSPELVGLGQDQRRDYGGRPGKLDEVVSMEPEYECSNSSQPPLAFISRQGPPPAREVFRATRGQGSGHVVKSAMDTRPLLGSSPDLAGIGSLQASVDHPASLTGFTNEPTGGRFPFDFPAQEELTLRNRVHCDAKVISLTFTRYEETTAVQPFGRSSDPSMYDVGYSQTRAAGILPLKSAAGKKTQASSIRSYKSPVDVDTKSIQGEHYPLQRHLLGTSKVARSSQQQEQNRYVLSGSGTSNKSLLQTESLAPKFTKPRLQPGGRTGSYTEYSPTVGREGPRGNTVDGNNGREAQQTIDKGKNVDLSHLPPISLFAPFKHSNERRSAELEREIKTPPGLSGESLLTPLFPSCGYKNDKKDRQGGADVSDDKFDSPIFAPYQPLSSLHNRTGIHGSETPLTLTPIFAPFKTLEEQDRPSASSIKTNSLPLDPMEQDGDKAVAQDIGGKTNVISDSYIQQLHHRGQSGHQLTAHGRKSSVYSSPSWLGHAIQQEAALFPMSFGSRFNEQSRVASANSHGSLVKEGHQTVNTSAIELSSRRPSLQEEIINYRDPCQANKDLSMIPSHDVQGSVSQGMRDLLQIDKDLQQQHLKCEAGTVRDLRPFSNLVGEASSGSSPIPGCAAPFGDRLICLPSVSSEKHVIPTDSQMAILPATYSEENYQQDKLKIGATSSTGLNSDNILEGPSPLVKDAANEQFAIDKQKLGGTINLSTTANSSDGVFSTRKSVANMEGCQGKLLSGQSENVKLTDAQKEKPERSSRKRTHEARTGESRFAVQNSRTFSAAVPQSEFGEEDESRTTSSAQSWLQRWIPSSTPAVNVFKPHQSLRTSTEQPSPHSKNPRPVQGSMVQAERLDEGSSGAVEQYKLSAKEKAGQWAGSNSENHRRRNSSLCQGYYPLPSAAAMALVGAASRRSVPLPPQRVGTRIAVWPAIAGMQLRRTESPGVLPPQVEVEVEVVVEEG